MDEELLSTADEQIISKYERSLSIKSVFCVCLPIPRADLALLILCLIASKRLCWSFFTSIVRLKMGFVPLDLAVHLHVCWFLYVSFYLEGESCPFSESNRRITSTKGLTLREILSDNSDLTKRSDDYFVRVTARSGLEYIAYWRINSLEHCLPRYQLKWRLTIDKDSPTDSLLGRGQAQNGGRFEFDCNNASFLHETRKYWTPNKTTHRKITLLIFCDRFWVCFIAFDKYNKY